MLEQGEVEPVVKKKKHASSSRLQDDTNVVIAVIMQHQNSLQTICERCAALDSGDPRRSGLTQRWAMYKVPVGLRWVRKPRIRDDLSLRLPAVANTHGPVSKEVRPHIALDEKAKSSLSALALLFMRLFSYKLLLKGRACR